MNRKRAGLLGLLASVGMGALVCQAAAADLPVAQDASDVTVFKQLSPWQIRVRALGVITQDDGSVDGVAGSDLSFSDTVIPELDITYFFTDNIAAELILGTTYAKVYGEGSISGLNQIGKTWVLPPTLTLQYHFTNFGAFKPYVGAGVNYTIFYSQSADSADKLHVKNAFGAAVQAGFDYMIDDHWGVNLDVKKIFMEPDFDVTVAGTKMSGKAELNPWLIGAGITYRF
ncbi:OmpW/AlkL family protein [Roseibium suaedae]|uniref:Outer membrane protein n=1 Tax=Roseibium suaedae TaxID=735517 RepID=A0A1M7B1R4_9HYPH|nr:OmpW family protein [Roseibium suaedae]SHL48836.1 outer membrane protein [Roseibium suaedae]